MSHTRVIPGFVRPMLPWLFYHISDSPSVSSMRTLKRMACVVLANWNSLFQKTSLSDEYFDKLDANGDGKISLDELSSSSDLEEQSEEELKNIMTQLDKDKNDYINIIEYLTNGQYATLDDVGDVGDVGDLSGGDTNEDEVGCQSDFTPERTRGEWPP